MAGSAVAPLGAVFAVLDDGAAGAGLLSAGAAGAVDEGAVSCATAVSVKVNRATSAELPTELIELRAALDRLGERARTVVVLRYFVDLPDREIAALLGCRVATVRSIAHRSLRTLREELS